MGQRWQRFTAWEYHIKKYWDKDKAKMYLGEKYDQITPDMIEAEKRATAKALLAGVSKDLHQEVFLPRLRESYPARNYVAEWLRRIGYEVEVGPEVAAGTHKEWKEYADSGDLHILPANLRVETKMRHKTHRGDPFLFTGAHDFPYPTFIVCAKHSWDRAKEKPVAYITLSADMKYAGCVYGGDNSLWESVVKKDSNLQGRAQETYVARLSDVFFCPTYLDVDPIVEAYNHRSKEGPEGWKK